MECLIGIKGKDFVVLATDTVSARSIVKMKNGLRFLSTQRCSGYQIRAMEDQDKMFQLNDSLLMAVAGEAGDTVQFSEYVAKNIQLYKMKNGYELSPNAAAHFTRRNVADALRTQRPKYVSILMAGVDDSGPSLFFLDYLGSMIEVPFAVHGYGGMFTLSVMDHHYKKDMTRQEVLNLLRLCVTEIQKRFLVDTPQFQVRMVSNAGLEDLGFVKPPVPVVP